MKNLVIAFAFLMACTFISCTNSNTSKESIDSTETVSDTDSIVNRSDSIILDTVI